jgi:NADH dehydrogenase [ubiquinone] 1 alpha subcomplex assembly factor 5
MRHLISKFGLQTPRCFKQIKSLFSSQIDVFDRPLKVRQREWSYGAKDADYYDYLRVESAARLVDRIEDISRSFPLALELGCHRGHMYDLIRSNTGLNGTGGIGGIETLIQCDTSRSAVRDAVLRSRSSPSTGLDSCASAAGGTTSAADADTGAVTESPVKSHALLADEEFLPFKGGQFDIVLSNLNLHWVNDLPSTLRQIMNCLKPDGVFLGSMLGGNTLQELRYCLYLAEQERRGGVSPHTSPFALASDVAMLMQEAGFSLPTIDIDTVQVSYPDAFVLMDHIVRMGEGTAALNRHYNVGKDTFLSAASLYQSMYGLEDGSVKATYQIIYVIGWRPDASQPKACKRGSATKSMKDIGSMNEK